MNLSLFDRPDFTLRQLASFLHDNGSPTVALGTAGTHFRVRVTTTTLSTWGQCPSLAGALKQAFASLNEVG